MDVGDPVRSVLSYAFPGQLGCVRELSAPPRGLHVIEFNEGSFYVDPTSVTLLEVGARLRFLPGDAVGVYQGTDAFWGTTRILVAWDASPGVPVAYESDSWHHFELVRTEAVSFEVSTVEVSCTLCGKKNNAGKSCWWCGTACTM